MIRGVWRIATSSDFKQRQITITVDGVIAYQDNASFQMLVDDVSVDFTP